MKPGEWKPGQATVEKTIKFNVLISNEMAEGGYQREPRILAPLKRTHYLWISLGPEMNTRQLSGIVCVTMWIVKSVDVIGEPIITAMDWSQR